VEIAKLSLWLRTAQPRRKLNDLSSTIKCGNSLIDDKTVAGDKAFVWENEFPEVFKNGGFDVVIGNPPYVRVQNLNKNNINFFEQKYLTATGKFDIYILFNELGIKIIKTGGLLSYIQPHKFINSNFGRGLRKYYETNKFLNKIISFTDIDVFEGATTYTAIFEIRKIEHEYVFFKEFRNLKPKFISEKLQNLKNDDFIKTFYHDLVKSWDFKNRIEINLLKKLKKNKHLGDIAINISQGVIPGSDKIYYLKVISEKKTTYLVKNQLNEDVFEIEKDVTKKIIKGNNIEKYTPPHSDYVIFYPYEILNDNQTIYSLKKLKENFPLSFEYISIYEDFLVNLRKKYKTNPLEWYGFHRSREMKFLEKKKIITSHASISPSFTISKKSEYFNQNVYGIVLKQNIPIFQVLSILNSKLTDYFMRNTSSMINGGYYLYKTDYLSQIPIIFKENFRLQKITEIALSENDNFFKIIEKFRIYILSQYAVEKLPKKLQNWHELDFAGFIKELNKAINKKNRARRKNDEKELPKLTKKDEFEWLDLFEENKKKAVELKTQIDQTDAEIDQMVYELYGLSEEEIEIVENS
jgi:hypothetical protein